MKGASRDDLHAALAQAAAVEFQLGLEYLYTAASLQWIPPKGLAHDDPAQVSYENARGAAKTLLLLARQEMEHQSWALNLLIATGGTPPTFDAPTLPVELPVGGPARLEPFSPSALLRYVAQERPDDLDMPPAPCDASPRLRAALVELEATDPDGYGTPSASAIYDHYVGIYKAIVAVEVHDGPVVVPPDQQRGTQVVPDPVYGVMGGTITTFESALEAVDQVVLEGEGGASSTLWEALTEQEREGAKAHGIPAAGPPASTTTTADRSHYCRLVELWSLLEGGNTTVPVLDVPTNPALPGQDRAPDAGIITHPYSVEMVGIGELAHGILLDALRVTYEATGLDPMDADAIHWTAYFQSMTMVIRPLLMVLARLPRDTSGGPARAGMTFRAVDRYDGDFDGTCDEARRDIVARLRKLSAKLEPWVGDGAPVPAETTDRSSVVILLQGLQRDLLRIAENLAVNSSTPLGG